MAVSSEQFTVTNAAIVALNTAGRAGQRLSVKNSDANEPVYLGGSAVTSADGFILTAGKTVTITLEPTEVLYAVSTVGGALVSVLRS